MSYCDDNSVLLVPLENFEKQLLPRIVDIKLKLDEGECFNDFDIEFIGEVLHEVH